MRTVREILRGKGRDVWSVGCDHSVYDALSLMSDRNVGSVLVVDAGRLVGIVSERDCARKVILDGFPSRETPVSQIMTKKVMYVRPDENTNQCMALMTDKRVRHLPVLEDDELVGIVSIGDVVKSIIDEQEFMIEQFEHYISGAAYLPPQVPASS